jgi:hypothetical protein
LLPDAEWRSPRHDEEKPLQDTYDRFVERG